MTDDFPQSDPPSTASQSRADVTPTWGPIRLAIGTAIFMFLPFVSWLSGPSDEELGRDVLLQSAIINLAWYAAMVSLIYFLVRRSGGDWKNLGLRRPAFQPSVYETARDRAREKLHLDVPRALVVPLVGYFACYGVILLYGIVINALGLDQGRPDEQIPSEIFDHQLILVLIGFSVLGAAPVVEEIFFRGFLFGGLRRWMPFAPAALISGFVFSLAHHDIGLIVPFTLIGAILAYTYERTGTLYGAMSVHFLFNFVSFSLLILIPDLRG